MSGNGRKNSRKSKEQKKRGLLILSRQKDEFIFAIITLRTMMMAAMDIEPKTPDHDPKPPEQITAEVLLEFFVRLVPDEDKLNDVLGIIINAIDKDHETKGLSTDDLVSILTEILPHDFIKLLDHREKVEYGPVNIRGNIVRLGTRANAIFPVHRKEVYKQINRAD